MVLFQAAPMQVTETGECIHHALQILTMSTPRSTGSLFLAPRHEDMTTATKFFRLHFPTLKSSVPICSAKILKVLTDRKHNFLNLIHKLPVGLEQHIHFSLCCSCQ